MKIYIVILFTLAKKNLVHIEVNPVMIILEVKCKKGH